MRNVVVALVLSLVSLTDAQPLSQSETCARSYQPIGCYKKHGILKGFELAITDRDHTDPNFSGKLFRWEKFDEDLHSLACRCNVKASEKGVEHFTLGFYAECWIGSMTGQQSVPSPYCVRKGDARCEKDDGDEKECTGLGGIEYVYKVWKKNVPDDEKCQSDINKVGCFTMQSKLTLLFNDQTYISQFKDTAMKVYTNHTNSVLSLACRCLTGAKSFGARHYSITNTKDCYIGDAFMKKSETNAGDICVDPKSNDICNDDDQSVCFGMIGTNSMYVYATDKDWKMST